MPATHAALVDCPASPPQCATLIASGDPELRIAKPILLVSTPFGVLFGLIEAWRVRWWLGLLMAAMVSVVGAFTWLTVRRVRSERGRPR